MIGRRPETFEPEVLAKLGSIYDETWASVAAGFEQATEATRAAARSRLAGILLELVEQQLVPENLKQRALTIFQCSTPATTAEATGTTLATAAFTAAQR
jgi:hypothetical protein